MSYNNKYNGYSGRYQDKKYRPKHGYDKHRSEEFETRDGSSHRNSPGFGSSYSNGHGSSHGESPSSHHRHDKHGEHGHKSTDKAVKPSSSSSYTPPKIIGTDPRTGENPNDSKFPKLSHHIDFKLPQKPREPDPLKNYKVLYDPELDSSLSKAERKAKSRKLRYNGGDIGQVTDPRAANVALYFQKPNKKSKKFPFKQLPQPKFVFDKDSLGPAPQTELVVWDLPPTTSEVYLSNYFNSYGAPIKDMRFINDSINAVPLGIATFKFQGNPEKAMKLAKNLIKSLKTEGAKIDGSYVKIGLNDHNNELLQKRIDSANEKLRAAIESKRRADEEKRRAKRKQEEEQRKQEEIRKKEEERKKKEAAEKTTDSSSKSRFQPNTTITSIREKNKVITGVFLPEDLKKYIKDRPYILIHDKYISTKRIPSSDIKKALNKYDWTRILSDKTGFYIVFNSLSECERCFLNNDGTKFYEYRMFMELCIPEGFSAHLKSSVDDRRKTGKNDIVDEAVNMLIKDFQTFLAKDIRERIIAPTVLDLLSHDKYPELVEELKAKEAKEIAAKPQSHVSTNGELKQNALSMLAKQKKQPLPFFKKKIDRKITKPGKSMIPMQHALNFDRESSDEDEDEDEDEEDAESSRSVTPVANNLKRQHQDDEIKSIKKHKKGKKAKVSFLYDSESETEASPKLESMEVDEPEEEEPKTEEVDYTNIEEKYLPTEIKPATVFPETEYLPTDLFDLDTLQDIIKDEEDMKYALQALENVPASHIKNIGYWAWKQKDMRSTSDEISEDTELIEKLDARLESKTGSFRSEGYRQIPDSDKIEYLPHRRKVHKPLKTILHENEEDEESAGAPNNNANGTNNNGNDTNTNSNHSSRVNRANNRRFAADITAQIGSETEVLSLNTLTKRKKPVSFARSAIHNWGLYALEPIAAKEMIIEYVGESIRQQVAENREKGYLKTGIGSSYLFRVDENTVIDATKKGGIARFINHCCDPSCTAKIIKVEGKKRIVIYALKDIEANEELTYDYKFERETNDEERIRCLCGAATCKGWLN